jgi:hypothetical protein
MAIAMMTMCNLQKWWSWRSRLLMSAPHNRDPSGKLCRSAQGPNFPFSPQTDLRGEGGRRGRMRGQAIRSTDPAGRNCANMGIANYFLANSDRTQQKIVRATAKMRTKTLATVSA